MASGPRKDAKSRSKRRRPPGRDDARRPTVEDRAKHALEALQQLGRALAEERGFGHGERLPVDALELPLRVPLNAGRAEDAEQSARELSAQLDERVAEALRASAAFRQGHVYCFLCDAPECLHSAPDAPDATFSGYTPTGKPAWQGFANLCMERAEPRVDRLYGDSPEIIAFVQTADELGEGLLPDFGRGSRAYRLLGQVVAGLVPEDLGNDPRGAERVALTFQLVETHAASAGTRFRLNVLGLTPERIAEAAADGAPRGPAENLRRTIRASRERVDALGRRASRASKRDDDFDAAERGRELLSQLRGDVERVFRQVQRRTNHAQARHQDGERPTRHALEDAARASDEHLFHDVRRDTVIVLGRRNRAHVFSHEGRHVTSIRLKPGEAERKTERERWKALSSERASAFRRQLARQDALDDG